MLELTDERSDRGLRRRLESIDWSFPDRGRGHELEAIHPYPAKFIADIPRALLSCLPIPEGTAVLDPFCGSGTTLTEAQRIGLPSIGIDLNPIACLLSRVKTAPFPRAFDKAAVDIVAAARMNRDPELWDIPNVDHWFKPEIQEAVAALLTAMRSCPAKELGDALRLALSAILVRVSNQESDTRYAAVTKGIRKSQVFELFLTSCGRVRRALLARSWNLPRADVHEADTLKFQPAQIGKPVGMIITSPPYPNAYEYWLYHKYRMWWLGFDPIAVKEREIGARAHFFKRKNHTDEDFGEQMRATFGLLDTLLVRTGFICFVVGRSRIHGRTVDNADTVQEVALDYGLRLVSRFDRLISPNRKSFNLAHANIKSETVLVFNKA